jgi:hypothetical protein
MGAWGWMYDVEVLEPLIHAIRERNKKNISSGGKKKDRKRR